NGMSVTYNRQPHKALKQVENTVKGVYTRLLTKGGFNPMGGPWPKSFSAFCSRHDIDLPATSRNLWLSPEEVQFGAKIVGERIPELRSLATYIYLNAARPKGLLDSPVAGLQDAKYQMSNTF